jgi:hypothetical protein
VVTWAKSSQKRRSKGDLAVGKREL